MELARREFLKKSMATLGFLALPGGLFAVPTGSPHSPTFIKTTIKETN